MAPSQQIIYQVVLKEKLQLRDWHQIMTIGKKLAN